MAGDSGNAGVVAPRGDDGGYMLAEAAFEVLDVVKGLPPKVQVVVALKSFGLSDAKVAEVLGYADKSGVRKVLERYNLREAVKNADALRKAMLGMIFNQVALAALLSIRENDLESLPASEKVKVAVAAIRAAESMRPATHEQGMAVRRVVEELIVGLPQKEVIDVTPNEGKDEDNNGIEADDITVRTNSTNQLDQERDIAGDVDNSGADGAGAAVVCDHMCNSNACDARGGCCAPQSGDNSTGS